MAYLDPAVYEEEDNPMQTRGGGAPSGSSVAGRPSAAPSKTGFVNTERYVEANKPQVQGFAEQIRGGIQGAADTSKESTGRLFEDFSKAQAPDFNYGQLATLIGQEGVQGGEAEQYGQALAAQNAPKNLNQMSDYQKTLAEHQKALELFKASESPQGYSSLVKNLIKPEQYTRGMGGLDTALLATSTQARGLGGIRGSGGDTEHSTLSPAARRFEGMGDDWLGAAEKQAGDIGKASSDRQATGLAALKAAAGGRLTGLEGQLKAQQEQAGKDFTTADKAQFDDYLKQIYQGYILPDRLDIEPYLKQAQLPTTHFGQFANAGQSKEFDLLKQLIDPGYTLGTGGYSGVQKSALDKKAYEKAMIDKVIERLFNQPKTAAEPAAAPDKKKADYYAPTPIYGPGEAEKGSELAKKTGKYASENFKKGVKSSGPYI